MIIVCIKKALFIVVSRSLFYEEGLCPVPSKIRILILPNDDFLFTVVIV